LGVRSRDNGQSSSLRIGEIAGELDIDSDSVSGNIYASWFTQTLNGDCGVWVDYGPGVTFRVNPDGGVTSVTLVSRMDLLPGQDVGVSYYEPDGDQVINVFRDPPRAARLGQWAGKPGTGGNMVLWVAYQNRGNAPDEGAYISATLDGGLVYLGDTSGFPHTGMAHLATRSSGSLDIASDPVRDLL